MGERQAIIVIGLAYGDCGKGSIVDFLVRRCAAHTVVRFNGGPQAGHNVVTPEGRHHTFAQFGSGTFVPGVKTLLSRFMLIEPYALFNEAAHLEQLGIRDAIDRLLVDRRCPVITPCHQAANRLRELARGTSAHGTCGMGLGEAVEDLRDSPEMMLHAGELQARAMVKRKLRAIRDLKLDQLREVISSLRSHPMARFSIDTLLDPAWVDVAVEVYSELAERASIVDDSLCRTLLNSDGAAIFEGAQGILLDERYGFHPHTTWSNTTAGNAEILLDEARHDGPRTRIGVLRTYFTRHGPGPFVTENGALRSRVPEPHNSDAGWQGSFRVGLFDAIAARYAIRAAGAIDALAITHLDRLGQLPPQVCTAYRPRRPIAPSDYDAFVRSGGRIVGLDPRPSPPEAGRLAHLLGQCQPICTSLPAGDPAAFLDTLRGQLKVRIGLVSFGPTARDKRSAEDGPLC